METVRFDELDLYPQVLRAIKEMGFEEATPIQSQAIPVVMSGVDVIGQAQTGTGKTASFGIPVLHKVDPNNKKTQVIILSPTRELAIQVSEEIRKLSKYMHGVKILPVYGGQDINRQIKALKGGAQIIIGTPGRVMDHLRRKTIRCEAVNTIVLDEADEMLNMGFREDIETILEYIPEEGRQTVLFSATMPKAQKSDLVTINKLIDAVFGDIQTSFSNADLVALAAQVFNYKLGETSGFPFNHGSTTLGSKGSVVVPCTFESNVIELHQFLFGDEEYTPSDTVLANSKKIINDTGMNEGSGYR